MALRPGELKRAHRQYMALHFFYQKGHGAQKKGHGVLKKGQGSAPFYFSLDKTLHVYCRL
jgi:hypothetical protein